MRLNRWAKILNAFDEALDVVQGLVSMAIEFGREPDPRHLRRADLLRNARRSAVEKERAAAMAERADAFGESARTIARYKAAAGANYRRMPANHDTVDTPSEEKESDAEIHQ